MSTSSGSIQKGEKGKSKYQSLDINSLYKGPETEQPQQKGTVPRKNGMQTLGKVPPPRRPPINLPSLKSETSGSEPAVSLVPPGSGGWGSKPGEGPAPSQQQNVPVANSGSGPPPPASAPVTPPVVMAPPTHEAVLRGPLPTAADKSWKAVTMGDHNHKLFTQQSPQFQQEFPKLASDGGVIGPQQAKNADAQYGPGPSLRPQTVGSWTGGGGRQQGGGPGGPAVQSLGQGLHPEPTAQRNNLGPHAVAVVPTGPAGLPNHGIQPYRPILMPPFSRPGAFPPNMGQQRYPTPPNYMMPPRQAAAASASAPPADGDESVRPILREEELSKMDEISRDPGWAAHQDIDYNKQLSFSDSEDSKSEPSKRGDKKDKEDKNHGKEDVPDKIDASQEERSTDWERSRDRGYSTNSSSRGDDEVQRVRDQVAMASERSRQRKDEAKRFDESRAGNKKFPSLDEKPDGGSTLFPEFGDRQRGEAPDDRQRQGERARDGRSGRNDRDREAMDREQYDAKPDHKYGREKFDRDSKFRGSGGRSNQRSGDSGGGYRVHNHANLPPRLQARGENPNINMMRSTGSPQPASTAPPQPTNNFTETQWSRRYEQDATADKRENDWSAHREGDRFKNGGRDRQYHPPYSEPTDHRRHYDRKEREEPDRVLDERDNGYKKGREWTEPPRHKDDRKESSEERELWRSAEQRPESRDSRSGRESEPRNGPQRQESRDNRESDVRGHPQRPDSRDSRVSREDEKDRRWAESRDPDVRGQLPKAESRNAENRGPPPRPDSRDSQPQRPESRDSRVSRDDEQDRRPQRPDSRDSRTSRDSRNSREEKMDIEHKPVSRFGQNHNQLKEEKLREDRDRREPQNQRTVSGHRDKQEKKPRPGLTQLRSEDDGGEAVASNVDKPESSDVPAKGEGKEEKEEKVLSDDAKQKGGKYVRGSRGDRERGGHSSSNASYGRSGGGGGGPVRSERRRRPSDRTSGASQSGHDEQSESSFNNWTQDANSSGEGGSELGKGEKEERNRETQSGQGREGFAPSGQPSRRGRGSLRVRGGSSTSRRMDGYGPPPSKAPFAQPEQLFAEEDDDPTKQKQAALTAGLTCGSARATAAGQPRAQPGNRTQRPQNRESNRVSKPNRPVRRGKPMDGEEPEEALSNSDGDDRKGDGRPRRNQSQNKPRPAPARSVPAVGGAGPTCKPAMNEPKEDNKAKPSDGETDAFVAPAAQDKKKNMKEPYKNSGGGPKGEAGGRSGGPNREKRGDRGDRTNKFSHTPNISSLNSSGPKPLMSQVVNPPAMMQPAMMQPVKIHQWRPQHLPPRLQKQQQQQQQAQQQLQEQKQQSTDASDMNKLPSSMGIFPSKGDSPQAGISAWEKNLGSSNKSAAEPGPSEVSSQRSSPANKLPSAPLIDDSSAPIKNTMIFENTNFKTGAPPPAFSPHNMKQQPRVEKVAESERKPGDEMSGVVPTFEKSELTAEFLDDPAGMKLPVYRPEQNNIMDFNFNAELDQINITSKLAQTKKLWESHPPVQGEEDTAGSGVFPAGFCQDPSMDAAGYSKSVESSMVVADDCGMMHSGDVVYSSPPMGKQDPATSSNVCKVKPQQQNVMSSGHSPLGPAGQSSLSPPPYSSSAQPGPFNYQQAGLGGSAAQFGGMPAIPSPPAMMPYSSQQLQANSGLFQAFPLEQARASQFSQYSAPQYGGLGGTSTYNQASLYLQHTAPPSADLYSSSMSQFRLQHPSAPFGQSQLNSNPNTLLLTSSTSSLMSASVKPSSQSIGAIGSKGNAFQQNSQVFIPVDPMQQGINLSFISNSGMVQRAAPVPPSAPNFYSNSAGPQTGFFGTPGSTLAQPGPTAPQMQPGYGLQGFGTQSSLQNFSSQSDLFQMGVPQYRTASAVGPPPYLKSGVNSNSTSQQDPMASVFGAVPQIPSPKSRHPKQMSQQSPTQPLPQAPSNKFASYPSSLVMSQQQSGGSQQRAMSGAMGLQGIRGGTSTTNRQYPSPIQRPPANRTRPPTHHRPPSKPYFDGQDGSIKIEETNDLNKADNASPLNCDPKLSEAKVDLIEDDTAKSAKE